MIGNFLDFPKIYSILIVMKRFFRLEHEGRGVYNCFLTSCDGVLDEFKLRRCNDNSPSPLYDKLLVRNARRHNVVMDDVRFSGRWRFGFSTKRKLLKWFNSTCLEKLTAIGIKIIVIENIQDSMLIRGRTQDVICQKAYDNLCRKELPLKTFLSRRSTNKSVIVTP